MLKYEIEGWEFDEHVHGYVIKELAHRLRSEFYLFIFMGPTS